MFTSTESDADSPYAGFFDLAHPENVWVNPKNVYNPEMMRVPTGARTHPPPRLARGHPHRADVRRGLRPGRATGDEGAA